MAGKMGVLRHSPRPPWPGQYLRANKLCNLIWNSYEAIVHACKTAWDFLINDPDRIRSIGARSWACVNL
jgi:hypothetical protein